MRKFTLLYISIAVSEIFGELSETRWLIYCTKPLIMLSLLFWTAPKIQTKSDKLFWAGMVFALAGDSFLMIRELNLFAFGLGSFFVMQICYIIAFSSDIGAIKWLTILPFVIYWLSFLGILHRTFQTSLALNPLWWPVVLYGLSLTAMGAIAALRKWQVSSKSYIWVTSGALLFILSDSFIAFNKFLTPIPGASFLIMSTYVAAQYLLVLGRLSTEPLDKN